MKRKKVSDEKKKRFGKQITSVLLLISCILSGKMRKNESDLQTLIIDQTYLRC